MDKKERKKLTFHCFSKPELVKEKKKELYCLYFIVGRQVQF